jgi:hypothetical protein
MWQIFEDRLQIVTYLGRSVSSQGKFKRYVPFDIKIKGTNASHTHSVDLLLISTLLPLSISPYLFLQLLVRSVYCGIGMFRWCITVKVFLRGVNVMLSIGWLLYPP